MSIYQILTLRNPRYLPIFLVFIISPIFGQDGIFDPYTLKTTIDCKSGVNDGLIRIGSNDKTGFIDKTGKVIIPPIYKFDAVEFSNGLVRLRKDNQYKIFNKNGQSIVPEGYKFRELRSGLVIVIKDNKYHILDKSGDIISPDYYDNIEFLSDSILKVKITNTYGLLDVSMNTIVPVEYDEIRTYKEDFAAISQGKKWGFINKKGKIVIPIEYQLASDFSNGLSRVFYNDRKLIIDKTGRIVHSMDEKYNFHEVFSGNYIGVTARDSTGTYKYGMINLQGIEVIPCKYDYINFCLSDGLASVIKNGKWGMVEKGGNVKVPFEYGDIGFLSKNLIYLQKMVKENL